MFISFCLLSSLHVTSHLLLSKIYKLFRSYFYFIIKMSIVCLRTKSMHIIFFSTYLLSFYISFWTFDTIKNIKFGNKMIIIKCKRIRHKHCSLSLSLCLWSMPTNITSRLVSNFIQSLKKPKNRKFVSKKWSHAAIHYLPLLRMKFTYR